jgi:hypothetical protein
MSQPVVSMLLVRPNKLKLLNVAGGLFAVCARNLTALDQIAFVTLAILPAGSAGSTSCKQMGSNMAEHLGHNPCDLCNTTFIDKAKLNRRK